MAWKRKFTGSVNESVTDLLTYSVTSTAPFSHHLFHHQSDWSDSLSLSLWTSFSYKRSHVNEPGKWCMLHDSDVWHWLNETLMYPRLIFHLLKNFIANSIQPKKMDNYIPYLSFVNLNKIIFPWVNKTNENVYILYFSVLNELKLSAKQYYHPNERYWLMYINR